MAKKTGQKKENAAGQGRRRFAVELTRKEMFLWGGVAFLALLWMFTLGVIVGRGLSPVRFDVEKLKKELVALKEEAVKGGTAGDKKEEGAQVDPKQLGFYDVLTDKKEEARLKSLPKRQEQRPPASVAVEAQKTSPVVQAAAANKEPHPVAPTVKAKGPETFLLQVASVQDRARADKLVETLKTKGYAAYAVTAQVSGKGTYHRVRLGPFEDRDDAIKMAARLRKEKLEPIVIRE